MARLTAEQADKFLSKGGSFFKLEDGDKKSVRFLYNSIDDIEYLGVHEFSGQNFATIDCGRQDGDPMDACKWCAMGNQAVVRVILPILDIESGEIQYWKRSATFVKKTLVPLFENLPSNAPISGQIFILGRTGKTIQDTTYTVAPDMRIMNDGKTKDQFGEIKDPFEMNMIRPTDYDFDPTPNNNQQVAPQATRRTADVF